MEWMKGNPLAFLSVADSFQWSVQRWFWDCSIRFSACKKPGTDPGLYTELN